MINLTYEQKKAIGLKYVLDKLSPASPYGIEAAKKLAFYSPAQINELNTELDNIFIAKNTLGVISEYPELIHTMSYGNYIIKSIRKTLTTTLDDVELFEIKSFLLQLAKIKKLFDSINNQAHFIGIEFFDMTDALDVVDPDKNRVATFYVSASLSPLLSDLREQKTRLEQQIAVTPKNAQTTLLSQHTEIARQEEAEELKIRKELTKKLAPYAEKMEQSAAMIARLDLIIAKAALAVKLGGIRPTISADSVAIARNMSNPMLSENLTERASVFTPIDISVSGGVTVITGANMGGKSVAVKTFALNALLAQMGFFVFAERFISPLFDFCSLAIAEAERSDCGLSTFGGEIVRLNETYQNAKNGFGLIVIDELAKGTNALEGQSIFRAVVQALKTKNSITLMTTHYDGVAVYADKHYQVLGLGEDVKNYVPSQSTEENIKFLAKKMNYGLKEVPLDSYTPKEAKTVCEVLGLDPEIMRRIK